MAEYKLVSREPTHEMGAAMEGEVLACIKARKNLLVDELFQSAFDAAPDLAGPTQTNAPEPLFPTGHRTYVIIP